MGSDGPDVDSLRRDPAAWDAFVDSTPLGTYPQLSAWADANRPKGWKAARMVADGDAGPIGALVLIHDMRPSPWARGYAARGPVAGAYTQAGVEAFTREVRARAGKHRLSHVVVDAEFVKDAAEGRMFAAAGWKRLPHIQPDQTRVVDLTQAEEALLADFRSTARWSINKSRRNGVVIDVDPTSAIREFEGLYEVTAERVASQGRMKFRRQGFEEIYAAYRNAGRATFLIARNPAGEAIAAILQLHCGKRLVELYAASNEAGRKLRANYLVKWESMRLAKSRGFELYDMWGTDEPWIAEFKENFGGELRHFDGAFELVTSRLGRAAFSATQRLRR